MKHGKKYIDSQKQIESGKLYETDEAVKLAIDTAKAKFDETLELHVRLGVDPRHADQQVRGAVVLPHGTPDMMGLVGRIGKMLGPKGLMPNPKSGTVTMDVAKAVSDVKAGKVEYRLDKTAIIHCPIGKKSFGPEKITENFNALMEAIVKAKPSAAKGTYIKSVAVSSTMGPGIRVNYRY